MSLDFDDKRLRLQRREGGYGAHRDERLRRWTLPFDACQHEACVSTEVVSAPETPGNGAADRRLEIRREKAAWKLAYEVVMEPLDAEGTPVDADLIRVTFPPGADRVWMPAPSAEVARFRVIDVSPFPRPCENGRCATSVRWR